jgi:hypothetical protein
MASWKSRMLTSPETLIHSIGRKNCPGVIPFVHIFPSKILITQRHQNLVSPKVDLLKVTQ